MSSETESDRSPDSKTARRILPPLVGLFGGGFVHSLLPRGAFGVHDIEIRALIAAGAAIVSSVVFFAIRNRDA
jgi:hypothetical protein